MTRRERIALAARIAEYIRRHKNADHSDEALALRFGVPLCEVYSLRHARD